VDAKTVKPETWPDTQKPTFSRTHHTRFVKLDGVGRWRKIHWITPGHGNKTGPGSRSRAFISPLWKSPQPRQLQTTNSNYPGPSTGLQGVDAGVERPFNSRTRAAKITGHERFHETLGVVATSSPRGAAVFRNPPRFTWTLRQS